MTDRTAEPSAALEALSPVDGRYADKCRELRALFSEAALIRHRVRQSHFVCQAGELVMAAAMGQVAVEAADLVPDVHAAGRVEAGRGLVQEQHERVVGEGERQVEAALHAAGVGADALVLVDGVEVPYHRVPRGRPAAHALE